MGKLASKYQLPRASPVTIRGEEIALLGKGEETLIGLRQELHQKLDTTKTIATTTNNKYGQNFLNIITSITKIPPERDFCNRPNRLVGGGRSAGRSTRGTWSSQRVTSRGWLIVGHRIARWSGGVSCRSGSETRVEVIASNHQDDDNNNRNDSVLHI